jgi:hypothetical protein
MNIPEQIVGVAALFLAITTISVFTFRVYKIARRIDDALGVDSEGRTISDRLSRVEHQLFPNGGSSLTDKINRIEFEQRTMQGKLDALEVVIQSVLKEGTSNVKRVAKRPRQDSQGG